jgi:hypothetical protein
MRSRCKSYNCRASSLGALTTVPLSKTRIRARASTRISRAMSIPVALAMLLILAGCADMEFEKKKLQFGENEVKTVGFYITHNGKYKIDELLTEDDVNSRFKLEPVPPEVEPCKGWKGEVTKEGKEFVGCLFKIRSTGLAKGETVTLTGKYEREPATVETPSRATLERP